jgi:hypothetical protein
VRRLIKASISETGALIVTGVFKSQQRVPLLSAFDSGLSKLVVPEGNGILGYSFIPPAVSSQQGIERTASDI